MKPTQSEADRWERDCSDDIIWAPRSCWANPRTFQLREPIYSLSKNQYELSSVTYNWKNPGQYIPSRSRHMTSTVVPWFSSLYLFHNRNKANLAWLGLFIGASSSEGNKYFLRVTWIFFKLNVKFTGLWFAELNFLPLFLNSYAIFLSPTFWQDRERERLCKSFEKW